MGRPLVTNSHVSHLLARRQASSVMSDSGMPAQCIATMVPQSYPFPCAGLGSSTIGQACPPLGASFRASSFNTRWMGSGSDPRRLGEESRTSIACLSAVLVRVTDIQCLLSRLTGILTATHLAGRLVTHRPIVLRSGCRPVSSRFSQWTNRLASAAHSRRPVGVMATALSGEPSPRERVRSSM